MLLVYDNLAAAKIVNVADLSVNTMVMTKGYYEPGDGGGATYLVKSNKPDDLGVKPYPDEIFDTISVFKFKDIEGNLGSEEEIIHNPFIIEFGTIKKRDSRDTTIPVPPPDPNNPNELFLQFDYQGEINIKQAGAIGYKATDLIVGKKDIHPILDFIINRNPFVRDLFTPFPNEDKLYIKNIYTAKVLISPDTYFLAETLEIKRTVYLCGTNNYAGFAANARLVFKPKTTGIKLAYITEAIKDDKRGRQGAGGSILEGLIIDANGVGFTSDIAANKVYGDHHGILMNIGCKITNCKINGFEGDGIRVFGNPSIEPLDSTSPNDKNSNADLFYLDHVAIFYVGGNGIYLAGKAANAGKVIGCDMRYTGRFGILDESALGNTYIACHADACGVRSNCFHKGKYYSLKVSLNKAKQPVKNIEPGIPREKPNEPQEWEKYWNPGVEAKDPQPTSTYPEWNNEYPYVTGGSYYSVGLEEKIIIKQPGATDSENNTANATSVFVGCYSEDSQYRIKSGAIIVGGIVTSGGKNDNCFIGADALGAEPIPNRGYKPEDFFYDVLVGTGNSTRIGGALKAQLVDNLKNISGYTHSLGSLSSTETQKALQSEQGILNKQGQSTRIKLGYIGNGSTFGLDDSNSGNTRAWEVTTSTYQDQNINHGRLSQGLPSGKMLFQQGFFLGSEAVSARFQGNTSISPESPNFPELEYGKGDILWNDLSSEGGNVGWICIEAGKPGKWVRFGNIENLQAAVKVSNPTEQNVITRFYNVGDIIRAVTLPDGEKIVGSKDSLVWNLPPGLEEVTVTFNAGNPINVKLGETVSVPA